MEILDQNDTPVAEPDETLGRLVPERVLVKEGIPYKPAKTEMTEYWADGVSSFYKQVEVEPERPAVPPVYKNIMRYIPYTPEELAKREADKLAAEEARKEAEAEAQRQAELKKKLEALPGQVESLEEAAAELGGVIGENDAILTQVQSDISDVMEAVAELGTLIVGEE